MIFAYTRVSTKEQITDRQLLAIDNYCKDNNIKVDRYFEDKLSGKNFDRPNYQALKLTLRNGDTLIIKELDRLGRNMKQIKEEWQDLQNIGIDIIVIDTPILNSGKKTDLEKYLISNIVFELLAYMSEKERLKLKTRQTEGISIAKTKGIKFGRPHVTTPDNFVEIYHTWKNGNISAVQAMKTLNLKHSTFYRKVKEFEKGNC